MEDLLLLRQMYADLAAKQQQESPTEGDSNPFAKAEEAAKEMGLTEQLGVPNPKKDIRRLAAHYKNKNLSKDQLIAAIGHDLEMLEYDPNDVSKMISQVLSLLGSH